MNVMTEKSPQAHEELRPETLRSFPHWEPPTAEEIRLVVRLAARARGKRKLTHVEVAGLCGASSTGSGSGKGSRTVRRWIGGESRIPYAAWAILCAEAGLGFIWRGESPEKDVSEASAHCDSN